MSCVYKPPPVYISPTMLMNEYKPKTYIDRCIHSKIQRVKFTPVKVKIYSLWESNNLWGRNYPISRVTITPLDDFDE